MQVVDSPFSKLTELMLELVEEQKIPIPRSLMRVALSMMRRSVKKRAGFSIDEVAPIDQIHKSFIPVLFGELIFCLVSSSVSKCVVTTAHVVKQHLVQSAIVCSHHVCCAQLVFLCTVCFALDWQSRLMREVLSSCHCNH